MKISVVINTYNRAASLRQALDSLRYQTYEPFEVIVVKGPCTDDTDAVLREFNGDIRVGVCPEINISKSRNVGIKAADGDVVAFIDDDALADPLWLAGLVAGYDSEKVGGVGGIVYDHTGYTLQYACCVCDRLGNAYPNVSRPLWPYLLPGGDQFVHLLGTNSSFRRDALLEIGGFDEEIEYYLDETDVCMRLIDRGYSLRLLDDAAVYHKFLASHLRNDKKILRKPFPVVKNKFYFSLQAASPMQSLHDVLSDCHQFAGKLIKDATWAHSVGRIGQAELASFREDVDRATRVGIDRGMAAKRQLACLPARSESSFLPFKVRRPARRSTICFASQEYPPSPCGGIGRFTYDVARGLAAEGHEIHVITRSTDHNRVDLEDGMWVHRVLPEEKSPWPIPQPSHLLDRILGWAAAVHKEVLRIGKTRRIDLVSAPVWDCEGVFCQFDDRLPFVLTLHTTMKTVADLGPAKPSPEMQQLLGLERYTVQHAMNLTAPSHDILEKVRKDYAAPVEPAHAYVIPHGMPDRTRDYRRRRQDDRVRILFVGRLEVRKGIDLLLKAAATIVREFTKVEFVIVGNDTIIAENRSTYRELFEARHRGDPAASRVIFTGTVSDAELYQHYADCDIFCAPARYESFGLVFLEAMMFGKPVIGTAAGGMSEVIDAGTNGYLIPPGDVEALTRYLRQLIKSDALRQQLGVASRKRYEREFSLDKMVQNTLRAYTEIGDRITATM